MMINRYFNKLTAGSLIEVLITLSIVSVTFMTNFAVLLNIAIRVKKLDKQIAMYLQREADYELQQRD